MRDIAFATSSDPHVRMLLLACLVACGPAPRAGDDDGGGGDDEPRDAAFGSDASEPDRDAGTDASPPADAPGTADAPAGAITGGPCLSGTPGVAAYRVRWAQSGSTAIVVYEHNGLPDHSRDHTGAFGFQIGFTPQFVDPFLGDGGLLLDSSDFVDIELSTAGIAQISNATLSIFGRSFDTTTSGSFHWQTFAGTGSAPTDSVSNVAPYAWYSADMTTELTAGDDGVLLRIKAGPSSGALVVNRIELCMQAS